MTKIAEYTCRKCKRSLPADQFNAAVSIHRPTWICGECREKLVAKRAAADDESQYKNNCPLCPKCGSASNKLAFDGYGTRYECTKMGCFEQFRVAAGRVLEEGSPPPQIKSSSSSDPDPPPTRSTRTSDVEAVSPSEPDREEKPMATNDGDLPDLAKAGPCRKGCGQELGPTPWGRKRHERRCDGPEEPAEPKPERRAKAAEPKARARTASKNKSAIPKAIEELRVKREALLAGIPELKEIDGAIAALEKLAVEA